MRAVEGSSQVRTSSASGDVSPARHRSGSPTVSTPPAIRYSRIACRARFAPSLVRASARLAHAQLRLDGVLDVAEDRRRDVPSRCDLRTANLKPELTRDHRIDVGDDVVQP